MRQLQTSLQTPLPSGIRFGAGDFSFRKLGEFSGLYGGVMNVDSSKPIKRTQ